MERRRPPRRPQVGQGDGRGLARGAGPCRARARDRRRPTRSSSRPTPTISSSGWSPRRRAGPRPLRVLTSDGEFHSARRQFARWEEDGWITRRARSRPSRSTTFSDRFLAAAQSGEHDLIFVSQVLFGSGRMFDAVDELAALGAAGRAVGRDRRLSRLHGARAAVRRNRRAQSAFYLGGGYKYAMAGEGCAFLHAPPGFGPRPPITGWFAEFEDLSLPPGSVGYAKDAMPLPGRDLRSVGALPVQRGPADAAGQRPDHRARSRPMSPSSSGSCSTRSAARALGDAELLNPLDGAPHARFLAFRSPRRAALVRASSRRRTASPTCAATCSGSASASTRTKRTSIVSSALLRNFKYLNNKEIQVQSSSAIVRGLHRQAVERRSPARLIALKENF